MKFTSEHLAILKAGVDKVLEDNPHAVELYEQGLFSMPNTVKDLQRRFCFDMFYASRIKIGDGVGTSGDIIGDYNDEHIFTALKAVCPKVERKY